MNSASGDKSAGLSRRSRFLAALVGLGLLAALLLAGQLQPDPRGWGTHEQLGLPRCTFLILAGKRCPACGMTTAWSYLVHGQVIEALRTHVSGTLLAAWAGVAAIGALVVAWRGSWWAGRKSEIIMVGLATSMVALILLEWIVRLLTE